MEKKTFSKYLLLAVLVILSFYIFSLLKGYVIGIVFSFIFAYLFQGTYDWLKKKVKYEWVAAGLIILMIFFAFFIPSVYLIYSFVNQAQDFLGTIEVRTTGDSAADFSRFLETNFNIQVSNDNAWNIIHLVSGKLMPFVERVLPSILGVISNLGVQVFLSAFILFYLLTNREYVSKNLVRRLPFSNKNSRYLLSETGKNTKALVVGQGLIALIQGSAGALGFFIFGIKGVFLWGMVMAIGSFIPFVGTGLVWVPASIILILNHHYYSGFGIFAWGMLVVGSIDNLVRPKLVSWLGNMHPVVVLLGVFIGIKEFNILGIIIGPLLLSTLLLLYRLFSEEYLIT